MITYQRLPGIDIARIGEIDRTEHVTLGYRVHEGKLEAYEVDWKVPRWFAEGDGDHSIRRLVDGCRPILEQGGVLLGALDGDRLAGLAILRHRLTGSMAQLAALFVSDGYRRQGIATRLVEEVFRLAREDGATEIYVSATPSESAVGFYTRHGFRLAEEVNEELFALEPEDIHMIRPL